ncbi:putative polygalacturonase [Iris pallida]|uniref:Polygalacturonase n=1 Tax=Iris pallida TaxID=29817 RepID=A0AAX6E046_IRIPA|nr:putative polygalacturonase [Iris pallida]
MNQPSETHPWLIDPPPDNKPWTHLIARPTWVVVALVTTALVGLSLIQAVPSVWTAVAEPPPSRPTGEHPPAGILTSPPADAGSCSGFYRPGTPRRVVFSIKEFGGVGDGRTSNTESFRRAVESLRRYGEEGGAQLNVPAGRWLTGSFNLTSNFTLYLEEGAVILGSQDPKEWPLIEPLPSYGRGRERPGPRHISLIHGNGLSDVVITGNNGSIDGQGRVWWELWWNRTLEHTRGHLLELVNSSNILIYNVTFLNSPFWNVHPVYCRRQCCSKICYCSGTTSFPKH